MALNPLLEGILVKAPTEAAAFAAGLAIHPTLAPLLQDLENLTWSAHPDKRLDLLVAAEVAAEDVETYDRMRQEASYSGWDADRFAAAYGLALNAPGIGLLFEMWRRGLIADGDFVHGLRKAKLEGRWDGPLEGLKETLLSSEELAMMQQQGFIDEARADSEGALQGVTSERQQLRFEASGLPPGIGEALEMLRRSIIDSATFAQIVREGHTKTKYTGVLEQLRDRVLSSAEYANLYLRGWITQAERDAGGALTGYTPAQMDLLYKAHGRPASPHQMFVGLRRGATIGGPTTGIPDDFLTAIRRSDIRPEYAELIWRASTTYPSAFVLRNLTEAGDISQQDAHTILLYEGWDPDLAAKVSAAWAGGTGAKVDPWIKKADTQLWTATHKHYVGGSIGAVEAEANFALIGIDPASFAGVLARWDAEKATDAATTAAQ